MNTGKRRKLERRGWRVGCAAELFDLSAEEARYIEIKLSLSRTVRECREKSKVTQSELARLLRSSQSRIAKMEACDPSVSMDLMVRALLALGAEPKAIARAIQSAEV